MASVHTLPVLREGPQLDVRAQQRERRERDDIEKKTREAHCPVPLDDYQSCVAPLALSLAHTTTHHYQHKQHTQTHPCTHTRTHTHEHTRQMSTTAFL